nr:hypothetical protein GCM10010200_094100 [Actinomadura rugatobispora]
MIMEAGNDMPYMLAGQLDGDVLTSRSQEPTAQGRGFLGRFRGGRPVAVKVVRLDLGDGAGFRRPS